MSRWTFSLNIRNGVLQLKNQEMKFYTVYILHSTRLGRYYIGYTGDTISDRIRRHNSNHKGYTGRANDWKLVYDHKFKEKQEAMEMEKTIKKRGAKRYLDTQSE